MAMNIDWVAAVGGAFVGWIACGKVDEVQKNFAQTVAAGSAEGVKAAWKQQARKMAKKAKKGAFSGGAGNGKNGKNG